LNTHKSGRLGPSSRLPRTQIESKRRRGGQPGNGNARKVLRWLDSYDLGSPEGVQSFLAEVVKRTWTGELGTRAAGALNGTLRLLLEHQILPELEKRITAIEEKQGGKST